MENKQYHLFLDDNRTPSRVTWIELPLLDWVVVKNYQEFVEIIEKNGIPTTVSFDHDLADEHYIEFTAAHDPTSITKGNIRYDSFKEKTGYDCAKYLAEYCVNNTCPIPEYYIHTLNPIGRMNIFSILESARKVIYG